MNSVPPDDLEDDALARALGKLVREREAEREPEWEAVARGELDVDEVAGRRRAAGDPDVDQAAEYFRPFAANETSALVDGLLESLGSPQVVPLRKRGRRKILWVSGGMLAAAAAVALWWASAPSEGDGETDGPLVATREPLPGYVLETDGGLAQLRGDTEGETSSADERHRYRRDTAFEWILRPEVKFEHAVDVRAFAFVDGAGAGVPLRLDDLAEVAPRGSIRIAGKIAALNLAPGRYAIVLAVGRPDELPTQGAGLLEANGDAAFVVRRVDVVIEE